MEVGRGDPLRSPNSADSFRAAAAPPLLAAALLLVAPAARAPAVGEATVSGAAPVQDLRFEAPRRARSAAPTRRRA